ncbi:MAG: DNA-binding NarL/FixJ family response regulator [Crocinitomix sp.]|jgi:DNA-binding NarL/FixJ family response regulator
MKIKILIADDHPLVAEGIKNSIISNENILIVKMAVDGREALEYIETNLVDLALLDIDMPNMNGIECATEILKHHKEVKVLMLSMYQEKSMIKKLIDLGVRGYLLKTIPTHELIEAIQTIHGGGKYFGEEINQTLLADDRDTPIKPLIEKSPLVADLTKRKKEIIKLITQGLTNSQMGEQLFISPKTVDTHRTNIMKKVSVNNVAGLIRFAFQNGIG